VTEVTRSLRNKEPMNNKNPLEALANRIGMYAYLAAVGGLEYWPTVRRVAIEERRLTPASALSLEAAEPFEESEEREKVLA
jgi:hypothetical protein